MHTQQRQQHVAHYLSVADIEAAELALTGSQLRQDLDFDFPSGRAKADLVQNAACISYRMALTGRVLDHFEVNAYRASTASRDLGAVDYAVTAAARRAQGERQGADRSVVCCIRSRKRPQ